MTTHSQSPAEPESNPDQPGGPPTDVSKPIGDAIPTPVEPGLDQPLPEKGEDPPPVATPQQSGAKPVEEALGDTETPPGVPEPGPSDFA